jgi:hypothetical protein
VCCTATAHGSLLHSQHHQQLVALPPCHPGRSRQQQQQQQQQQQRAARGRSARLAAAASNRDEPPPSREDRANPTKADFSAYWSLKFREFFSKRRAYLQAGRKQQEQPEIFRKLDEAIAVQVCVCVCVCACVRACVRACVCVCVCCGPRARVRRCCESEACAAAWPTLVSTGRWWCSAHRDNHAHTQCAQAGACGHCCC